MTRCTGHCCKCFYLPIEAIKKSMEVTCFFEALGNYVPETEEVKQIAEMVIPLGVMTDEECLEKFGVCSIVFHETGFERFTCKHLLENGDCGNYENRPEHMCGKYPYGKGCNLAQCTMKETK